MASTCRKLLHSVTLGLILIIWIQTTVSSAEDLTLPDPLVVLISCQQSTVAPRSSCQSAVSNPIPAGGFTDAATCSKTQPGRSEWWQAQLPPNSVARVTFVRVDQLNHCCGDSSKPLPTVTIDGNDCPLSRVLGSRSRQVFFCNRTGQAIRVTSGVPQTPLTVCRVQVFAEYLASYDTNPPRLQLLNCSRSATIGPENCQQAIDSIAEQSLCSSVPPNGWWEARTQDPTLIKFIRIRTFMYCCLDTPLSFSVTVDGDVCISYSGTYFTARDFLCNRTGQALRVVSRMQTALLLLCEVVAFGDAESRAPVDYGVPLSLISCSQSSSVRGGSCRKAIDSRTTQTCGECARTRVEQGWWQGSTVRRVLVKFVRLFLPVGGGCGPQDMSQALVTVSGKECTPFESSTSVHTLFCNATGRQVTIRNLGNSELTVCEVQAMGEYLEQRHQLPERYKTTTQQQHRNQHPKPDQSMKKHHQESGHPHHQPRRPAHPPALSRCLQSSTAAGSRCHLAIDGSRKRCAKTIAERAAWWQAGIHGHKGIKSHHIATVIVALQHDLPQDALSSSALNRLRVSVNSQPCKLHAARHGSGAAFECNRVGSLVRVSNQPGSVVPLVLCEVLVLGWPLQ